MKSIVFRENDCKGCGQCMDVCRTGALHSDKSYSIKYDRSLCVGCGACLEVDCAGDCFSELKRLDSDNRD